VLQGLSVFPFADALVGAALAAADELGIWETARLPISVEELARQLKVDTRRLHLLVDLLCAEGALERDSDRVRTLKPSAGTPLPREGVGRMVEVLRTGVPISLAGRSTELHAHLWPVGEAAARELWTRLGAGGLLLDAGGGAGPYSSAWLEASPTNRAHLIDRAPAAQIAREKLARFGERARVSEGEIEEATGAHDVGLLCNVLHLYPPAICERLVAHVAACATRIVIKDSLRGSRESLAFALALAIYGDGDVHSEASMRDWLARAGVREVQSFEIGDQIVLTGTR
jgi:hypothetical protein